MDAMHSVGMVTDHITAQPHGSTGSMTGLRPADPDGWLLSVMLDHGPSLTTEQIGRCVEPDQEGE